MIFIQEIFDQILANIPSKKSKCIRIQRLKYQILMGIRRWLIQHSDPLVYWKLGGKKIQINLSHQLPFLLATHPNYNTNLPRIAQKVFKYYPMMTVIDIGANIGDSAALLRERSAFPILCIEGEERYFRLLKKNSILFPNLQIEQIFLGKTSQMVQMKIEAKGGTATLHDDGNILTQIHLEPLDKVLERHPSFGEAKLLKIDTDGFDAQILRGSQCLLARSQPVIFFEYDPFFLENHNENGLLLFGELKNMGYKYALVYENVGDFMVSVDLDDNQLLKELHYYFSARGGKKYGDIALFHQQDKALFESCRDSELMYYPKRRYETANHTH